jgi:hypothetical protein
MTSIRAAQSRTNPKPSLREIQAVSNISSDTIEWNPFHQALVNAALVDQVAEQIADRIVSKLGDVSGSEPKAPFQASSYVVLPTPFPSLESPSCRGSSIAWIKSKHHFTQRN